MPSLSAIVPATNAPATLDRCLEAIRRAAAPPEEVIVTSEPPAAGPAAARNTGAERAAGDVLVFVDADVEVHEDAFRRIREAFEADPELVGLFGAYDDDPSADGTVSAFRNLLHHHVHRSSPGPAETFWAGLGAVRREAFAAAGGFDEKRYPRASIEDVELGLRLSGAGARIELDPEVQGKHLKRWTLGDMVRTDFARRGVPWAELVLAGRGGSMALNLGWRHRLSAGAAVSAPVALLLGRARMALAAVAALIGLNRDFYALLWRRLGPLGTVQGVGLHALHHLVSVVALAAAALAGVRRRSDGRPRRPARHPGSTLTDPLRRGLRVLREEGLRAFLLRFLDWAGLYRRLAVLVRPADGAPIEKGVAAVAVERLDSSRVEDYLAFRPDQDRGVIERRFAEGHVCFAARLEGRLISAMWVCTGKVWSDYLGRDVDIPKGLAFVYDNYTLPEQRRRVSSHAVGSHVARWRRANDLGGFALVLPENVPGMQFVRSRGYQPRGTIGYLKIGPWRRDFERLRSD